MCATISMNLKKLQRSLVINEEKHLDIKDIKYEIKRLKNRRCNTMHILSQFLKTFIVCSHIWTCTQIGYYKKYLEIYELKFLLVVIWSCDQF